MERMNHPLGDLFEQLGLPADDRYIERFIAEHSMANATTRLSDAPFWDAPFWTAAQAGFLREELLKDADWAESIDQLNAALRR